MPLSLGAAIEAARHLLFIGRDRELATFRSAVEAPELPFHVLAVHGSAGVGKTYLLHECRRLCREREVQAYYLDGRDVEPTASAFLGALRGVLGGNGQSDIPARLTKSAERLVLFIDSFERLHPMERWIREGFLPALSTNVLLVLAGRNPLPASWRADPGISPLIHALALRKLTPEESRSYLSRRQVQQGHQEELLSFAHGHPLALSLLADAYGQSPHAVARSTGSAEVLAPLLQRFLQEVPSELHRRALEAAAIVNYTTEDVLSELLTEDGAHELFVWLRSLSSVEGGPRGIYPHAIMRDVLVGDMQWRHPAGFDRLLSRARRYYARLLKEGRPERHEHILADYVFAHRYHPVVRPFFERLQAHWNGHTSFTHEPVRAEDLPALHQMVVRHEGNTSAKLFSYWAEHSAADLQVFRGGGGEIGGFALSVALHELCEDDVQRDPAAHATLSYLDRHAALRSGERATLFRFWVDAEQHQAPSVVQCLIFAWAIRHCLTTPRLAFCFLPCADPESWQHVLGFAGLTRLGEADYVVNGNSYGVFGHDWRVAPPSAWLESMGERLSMQNAAAVPRSEPGPALLVMSRSEFAAAVKMALKSFPHEDGLQRNPLLRSRLVLEAADGHADLAQQVRILQDLIRHEAERLNASPAGSKCYRALYYTYLVPKASQERAAEQLDVPYSTFRRHLRSGIQRITDSLWQREVGT